jgi:hypothetical protein
MTGRRWGATSGIPGVAEQFVSTWHPMLWMIGLDQFNALKIGIDQSIGQGRE